MNKEITLKKAEASLNNIRPFLNKDGGDVKIIELTDEGVLNLEFLGNCSTCSMSSSTFKNGIQENIKNDVPEITEIKVINLTEELI